jgi:hypothetical protein
LLCGISGAVGSTAAMGAGANLSPQALGQFLVIGVVSTAVAVIGLIMTILAIVLKRQATGTIKSP